VSSAQDEAKKAAQLDLQQAKLKQDLDQAASTYNTEIAQLKRENEQIKRRFEETNLQTGSQVSQIQSSRDQL